VPAKATGANGERTRRAPPNPALLLLEGPRAVFESLTLAPSASLLLGAPQGDGHPVLVLPGFTAGDGSTQILRRYLSQLGYSAHPWLQGVNLGLSGTRRRELMDRVAELHRRHGRKISIVGWSLGGIYARELAKRMSDQVRQVVTLGSPFAGLRKAPSQPTTSIYTRTDGIVHWSSCVEEDAAHTENIEVPGSHCGLGFNPLVLYAIADRLAQSEGEWQPFDRGGWRRLFYG